MKKLWITILLVGGLGLAGASLSGCDKPCTKAVDRLAECMSKDKKGKLANRDQRLTTCRKNAADQKAAKACLDEKGCDAFIACMEKVGAKNEKKAALTE